MGRFKLAAAAVVAAFVLTGTATAAAQPSPLYSTEGGYSCTQGALDTSGATFGAANIRVHSSDPGTATLSVRLRGATPNATFDVYHSDDIQGSGCITFHANVALDTNDRGNGRVRTDVNTFAGTVGFNVLLQAFGQPVYATPEFAP